MTNKEKLELIKDKFPNYKDMFSEDELSGLLKDLDDPEKLTLFRERGFTEIREAGIAAGVGTAAKAGVQAAKGLLLPLLELIF